MPTDVKDHLKSMITNLIDDNVDAARDSFHDALKSKMQDRLNPQPDTVVEPELEQNVDDDDASNDE